MTNIWGIFIQTIELSLIAAGLLLIKLIFTNKISPRWQYGIWSVFLLRVFLPAGILNSFISYPFAAYMQAVMTTIEKGLGSAYTDAYSSLGRVMYDLPVLKGIPVSITDWIFAVYAGGVLFVLLRYVIRYSRLRMVLYNSMAVSEALQNQIDETARKYQLKSCKAVTADGISSAFVCGIIKPIMVMPAAEKADEKIILHELLHLQYWDNLQNIFWSILKALHWCNPFLQYVFGRISNDLESLCDQRVLERLSGEERREYGKALLAMTNKKYACAPGTTSISNGGKNIKRRIEAIAHFKKYSKGMALASVCIGVILASFIIVGDYKVEYPQDLVRPQDGWQYEKAVAQARVRGCSTIAGAVDTYVKGMALKYPAYVAAITPEEQRADVEKQLLEGTFYSSQELRLHYADGFCDYSLNGLEEVGEDKYTAQLLLLGNVHQKYEEPIEHPRERVYNERRGVLVPVNIIKEEGSWRVAASDEAKWLELYDDYTGKRNGLDIEMPETYTVDGSLGKITISYISNYLVDNLPAENTYLSFNAYYSPSSEGNILMTRNVQNEPGGQYFTSGFNTISKPNAHFDMQSGGLLKIKYENNLTDEERKEIGSIGIGIIMMKTEQDILDEEDMFSAIVDMTGSRISSSDGRFEFHQENDELFWRNEYTHIGRVENMLKRGDSIEMNDFWGWQVYFFKNGKLAESVKVKRDIHI